MDKWCKSPKCLNNAIDGKRYCARHLPASTKESAPMDKPAEGLLLTVHKEATSRDCYISSDGGKTAIRWAPIDDRKNMQEICSKINALHDSIVNPLREKAEEWDELKKTWEEEVIPAHYGGPADFTSLGIRYVIRNLICLFDNEKVLRAMDKKDRDAWKEKALKSEKELGDVVSGFPCQKCQEREQDAELLASALEMLKSEAWTTPVQQLMYASSPAVRKANEALLAHEKLKGGA